MSLAEVRLWGKTIGAVSWDAQNRHAYFEYDAAFIKSSIEIAPLTMPLSDKIFSFPNLNPNTFKGLPGLLADSLPDAFGNALIDQWLQAQGRSIESFNPVERLTYVGSRGMGALEYVPAVRFDTVKSRRLDIEGLVELASDILSRRMDLHASFDLAMRSDTMRDILRVGTSAGGARAKAIIAWNADTNEVRSGQVKNNPGFTDWLLKFDGVNGNRDKELDDPQGYGLIEYAYYQMARKAGITMNPCRVLSENNRHHFMTKRFDRTDAGEKIHMLSLCAMCHYDFNMAGAYSYEQAFYAIRELGLGMKAIEEQYRRMVFNIIARNQDDHVKNIAFLMDKSGRWSLSPAYDVTYSYNPDGQWTNQHQMSVGGKRDGFELQDLIECAHKVSMSKNTALDIIEQVQEAVALWPKYAAALNIPDSVILSVNSAHRVVFNRN